MKIPLGEKTAWYSLERPAWKAGVLGRRLHWDCFHHGGEEVAVGE